MGPNAPIAQSRPAQRGREREDTAGVMLPCQNASNAREVTVCRTVTSLTSDTVYAG